MVLVRIAMCHMRVNCCVVHPTCLFTCTFTEVFRFWVVTCSSHNYVTMFVTHMRPPFFMQQMDAVITPQPWLRGMPSDRFTTIWRMIVSIRASYLFCARGLKMSS